ncbi:MAG: hypothetical protein WC078_06930, partial [Dysgonamonadaceae bacterium]
MNKFEASQEQPKDIIKEIKETKQELELLLNNPEENKEGIFTLSNSLKELNNILEQEIEEETEKALSPYKENPNEIKS